MAGGYSGANKTLVNTVFKAIPHLVNRLTSSKAGTQLVPDDIKNAPRMLTPVLAFSTITTNNGFTTANLRPGDIVTVLDVTATGADAYGFMIRNAANTGWIKFAVNGSTFVLTVSEV